MAPDILSPVPDTRPDLTGHPVALFVFSNLREQKGGLTRAWLRRLSVFHEAGWDTHIATIHPQPEIDETLDAWRERGWLPAATSVHHYQRRDKRFRPSWSRRTDETFTRDDRVADWLDWLVGRLPGVVVFADSPVTYAPVAMMRNPYVGRIMTVHLAHRTRGASRGETRAGAVKSRRARQIRSRYAGPVGQPRLSGRLLPFAGAADAVVALTRRQASDLQEDVPGLEVHVIPNMIDPVPPRPGPGPRSAARGPARPAGRRQARRPRHARGGDRRANGSRHTAGGLRPRPRGGAPPRAAPRAGAGGRGVVPGLHRGPDRGAGRRGSLAHDLTSGGFRSGGRREPRCGDPGRHLRRRLRAGRAGRRRGERSRGRRRFGRGASRTPWSRCSRIPRRGVGCPRPPRLQRSGCGPTSWPRSGWTSPLDVAARIEVPSPHVPGGGPARAPRRPRSRRGRDRCRGRSRPRWRSGEARRCPSSSLGARSSGASRSDGAIGSAGPATCAPPCRGRRWPGGRRRQPLSARTADGANMPVVGPGLPVTVAPTDSGPVLVGWDDQQGGRPPRRRARIPSPSLGA